MIYEGLFGAYENTAINVVSSNNAVNTRVNNNIKAEAQHVYDYFIAKKDLFDEAVRLLVEKNNMKPPTRWYLVLLFFTFIPGCFLSIDDMEIIGWILLAFWVVMFVLLLKQRKKKMKIMDERLLYIDNRTDEIFEYLGNYYDAYHDCPIGVDYIWPEDLEQITDYILSGRAESFKEAMNLYHQQEQLDEMQRKFDAMVQNTEIASAKAGLAAHFSAMNYIFNK